MSGDWRFWMALIYLPIGIGGYFFYWLLKGDK